MMAHYCERCVYNSGDHLADCPILAESKRYALFLERIRSEIENAQLISAPTLIRQLIGSR